MLVFGLHVLLVVGMVLVSYMLRAPIFGVSPASEAVAASFYFTLHAMLVMGLSVLRLRKNTAKTTAFLLATTLLWIVLWCVFISPYDMIYALVGYLALVAFLGFRFGTAKAAR